MDELNVFGTAFMVILGLFIYWLSSSTVFILVWVVVTLYYAKNRWLERFLSTEESAADEACSSAATSKHINSGVARTRSMKSMKKYDWGSYDSTYNEHWRQRLMSFSAVQLPSTKSSGGKSSLSSSSKHYSPTPEAHKSRSSPHFPLNKSPTQTMSKMRKNAEEAARNEWTSPLKAYKANYSLGVYPKVNLSGAQPILLSDYRGNMKKKRVTVKLSPVPRPAPPETDLQMEVETNIISNLRKSSRKRQMKVKPGADALKKQRVGESPVESVLPDHFIEDASTSTNALKNLEKVHNALSPPKTNAIDSSFSSMKRMRNQTHNSRKRDCSSVDLSTPKTKFIRKDTEQVQDMETSYREISLEKSPLAVSTSTERSREAEMIRADLSKPSPEAEQAAEENEGVKQLYIPSLQDHLDDREAKFHRLQNILKKISNTPPSDKNVTKPSTSSTTASPFTSTSSFVHTTASSSPFTLAAVSTVTASPFTLTTTAVSTPSSLTAHPSPKQTSEPVVSSSEKAKEVSSSLLGTSTPLKPLSTSSSPPNGELKFPFSLLNGVDKIHEAQAAVSNNFGNLSSINATSAPSPFPTQDKILPTTSQSQVKTTPTTQFLVNTTPTTQFQFQEKSASTSLQFPFQDKTVPTTQFQFQEKILPAPQFQDKVSSNQFQMPTKAAFPTQFQLKDPSATTGTVSSELKSSNPVFTFGSNTAAAAAPSLTNGFNFSATAQPSFTFGAEASKFSSGTGSTAPRRTKGRPLKR